MATAVELIQQAQATEFVDRKGKRSRFAVSAGMADAEIDSIEAKIEYKLPAEMRELMRFCRSITMEGNEFASEIDFSGQAFLWEWDQNMHALPIATDGAGNHWAMDLVQDDPTDTTILFLSHDPPVVIYQANSITSFISELLRRGNSPWASDLDFVYDECSTRIWKDNPGTLTYEQAIAGDADLKAFAESLDDTYIFFDMRNSKVGEGFSWGRYGAETVNKRFGSQRMFAYQKKELTWWQKIFGV